MYQRNDIYYCTCCAQFYRNRTHERVDIPYHEMPAEMAIDVMLERQMLATDKLRRTMWRTARKHAIE